MFESENKQYMSESVFMVEGKCPRCSSDTVQLGTPIIKVGKTRGKRVVVRECPECMLVFYERMKEL